MAKKPKKIELNDDSNDFVGTKAPERIFGNGGDDSISGGAGADKIYGGEGNDTLKGGSGSDTLNGGAGDDIVFGGGADDMIIAGIGADNVNGGAGDDTVKINENYDPTKVTKNSDGSFDITTAAGSVHVANVEVFRFADKTITAEELGNNPNEVTLTEGKDVVTGNIINAPRGFTPGGTDQVNTLNDDDVITGTGTNATLNIDFVNDADTGDDDIQATINKIETINVDVRTDDSATLDLQDEDGSVKNINVEGIDDDVSSFTVDNIQNLAGAGTGINLSVNDSNAPTSTVSFLFDGGAATGDADTVNVTLNDAEIGTLVLDDADNTANLGAETINLKSTGSANSVGHVDLEDTKTLNITGDKDLSLANSSELLNGGVLEAEIHDGAFIDAVGSLATVNAKDFTGNLELNLGGEVTAKADGSSGVDVEFNVVTGSGNDIIRLTSGFNSAGDKIDAGTGDNTLFVYDGVAKGSITNVQHLTVVNQEKNSAADVISVDASLFTGLKDITVRNVGYRDPGVGEVGFQVKAHDSDIVLNKLTADLAKAITIQHSTTLSNGLALNALAANLAADTASDTVSVTVVDGVNADPRFNFQLQTAGVENITINDTDTESNTVLLGADGTNAKDLTPTAGGVSDITGTVTLTGGKAGQFLNLDAGAGANNVYGFVTDGSATDGTATQLPFLGVGKSVFDATGLALTASKIDAATFAGDVVVRVADAEDAKGVETVTGGQTITLGTGNDTVVFDDAADIHAGLTISDVVSGGTGSDTLALEGSAGTKIVIGASEWTNVSGFETIRLTGTGGPGNAGKFGDNDYNLVLTNELIDKNGVAGQIAIVNDNNLSDENPAILGTLGAQQQRGVTIDARGLNASHSFSYNGAEGVGSASNDRFILTDATINGTAIINGGFSVLNSNLANGDILEARNASQVTIGDLNNVSNVGTLSFTNDTAVTQTSTLELNTSIIDALVNSSHTAKAGEIETLTVSATGSETIAAAGTTVNVDLTGVDFTKVGVIFTSGGGTTTFNVTGLDLATESVTFNGGAGDDTFTGGAGNDNINGGGGNDTLNGGAGNDTISDGAGTDIITGGAGNDIINLTADGAVDRVAYSLATDGVDQVNGFVSGSDLLVFTGGLRTALDDAGAANGAMATVEAANGDAGAQIVANLGTVEAIILDDIEGGEVTSANFGAIATVVAELNEEFDLAADAAGGDLVIAIELSDTLDTAYWVWTSNGNGVFDAGDTFQLLGVVDSELAAGDFGFA